MAEIECIHSCILLSMPHLNFCSEIFGTGPGGPELEDQQAESKAKELSLEGKPISKRKTVLEGKLIRRTCPSGHGSDNGSPKWYASLCSENAAKTERSQVHLQIE